MPASSTDSLVHIEESLRSSLQRGTGADEASALRQRLISSSKRILLEKIDFEPAINSASQQFDSLRTKYMPLNPSGAVKLANGSSNTMNAGQDGITEAVDGLPAPKVVLYPAEKIRLEWNGARRIGAGLHNLGNTCFLNSTLQCLTYTPPLVNYLISKEHSNCCKQVGFCVVCELQRHVQRCHDNSGQAIKPHSILQKIKLIAKHMHWGRQEDAHEFLRYMVEAMQKACLNGYTKLDRFSKETTVVNQIFGGFLQSQVICLRCKAKSNTYDPFMDICLDVKNVPSVQKAFEKFVQPEMLDHDNAYNCIKCKQKVPAKKRFSLHKAPNTLTIQLKRYSVMGGKVTRHISFPEKLDVRPYMSNKQGEAIWYQLYAVLVHMGMSTSSGHYFSYVRAPNQTWYCMNDSSVQQTSVNRVLNAEAYLLFFVRRKSQPALVTHKTGFIGPKLPNQVANGQLKNGHISMPSNELGQAMSRKLNLTPQPKATKPQPSAALGKPTVSLTASANSTPKAALASMRDKVSFEIRSNKEAASASKKEATSAGKKEAGQPRIVMHIKNGKVVHSSVADKKDAVAAAAVAKVTVRPTKLVPYDSNNSDESDGDSGKHKAGPAPSSQGNAIVKDGKCKTGEKVTQLNVTKETSSFEPQLDASLTTTTVVPGSYGPLTKEPSSGEHKKPDARLSVVPNVDAVQRVNATTRWNIMTDQDAALKSPSIASEASSSHSTTDWQVTSSTDKSQCILPEAHHVGWTVTPTPANGANSTAVGAKTEQSPTSVRLKKLTVPADQNTLTQLPISAAASQDSGTGFQDPRISSSDSELCPITTHKNTLPNPRTLFPSLFDEMHHKESEKSALGQSTSKEDDSKQEVNSPMFSPSTPSLADDVYDLAPLINGHSSNKKKHRKHKKKQKKRSMDEEEISTTLDDSAPNEEASVGRPHKKKKKKKKHYHDDADERPLLDSSTDADTAATTGGSGVQKSGEELTWVEKTKETMKARQTPPSRDHALHVPTQHWDEHAAKSTGGKIKGWDGVRSGQTNVVQELLKTSSSRGFGAQVTAWDGTASRLNLEVKHDKQNERKRHWDDEYEEDLDCGKTKKVKKVVEHSSNNSHASFQKVQDHRNAEESRRRSGHHGHSSHQSGNHHHSHHHSNSYHRDHHSSHRQSHGSHKKHRH